MRNLLISILCILPLHALFAQDEVEALVRKGIEYHDAGSYSKAIATYMEALALDPQSALIHYELSYSFYQKGDLAQAIEYADFVLKKREDHLIPAYIIKGSALDDLGQTKASIKLFKKALKKEGGHYLLYYNLALNQFRIDEYQDAEANLQQGLALNPSHGSSHLMMAKIHALQGNITQSILSAQFFLLLEPTGERAKQAYAILDRFFGGNVTQDGDNATSFNISINASSLDSPFGAAEMTLGLMQVANVTLEENLELTSRELYVKNMGDYVKMLGEMAESDAQDDIWWNLYIPFFDAIAQTEHMEAFAMYVRQVGDEEAAAWLEANEPAVKDFLFWLEE